MTDKAPLQARVTIYPRPEILDPQGKAVAQALGRLGFDQVREVRVGKSFDVHLDAADAAAARAAVEDMCKQLLANDLLEDFQVEILPGKEG